MRNLSTFHIFVMIIATVLLSSCAYAQDPCGGPDNPCGPEWRRRWREYGNIRDRDEAAVLDSFAKGLHASPDSIAYFLIYAGPTPCKDEAFKRGLRAKNYLVRNHGISPDRIIWRDGGFLPDSSTQIWLLPRGVELPEPQSFGTLSKVRATKKCKFYAL